MIHVSGRLRVPTSFRGLPAAILAWMLCLAPPAVAQGAGGSPEADLGPIPRLGNHRFAQSTIVQGPFLTTTFRNRLGVGASDGFQLGDFQLGDSTLSIQSGELLYTDVLFHYQQAVKDWLAFSLSFGGAGRLGTETTSLVVQGVNVGTALSLGWKARCWQTEDMLLSASFNVRNTSFTLVDLPTFLRRLVEDGGLEPGNTLVRSVPILLSMGGVHYAYGASDLLGLTVEATLGYGESLNREASSEWYHTLGLAVDFDLNPRTSVPVGIAVGSRYYNVPMGDPDLDGSGTSAFVRISHTGTRDFNLGLEVESQWLDLRQLDERIRYTSASLDLQYYF